MVAGNMLTINLAPRNCKYDTLFFHIKTHKNNVNWPTFRLNF